MADISPIGPGAGPGPVHRVSLNGHHNGVAHHAPPAADALTPSQRFADTVELSERARYIDSLMNLPEIRQDVVERARQVVQQEGYPSEEQLTLAIERMMADLEES